MACGAINTKGEAEVSAAQSGIFAEGSAHHYYLEYRISEGAETVGLRDALATGLSLPRAQDQLLVTAFGEALWQRLAPGRTPFRLRPFETIGDPAGRHAPATQRDIWFWLQATAEDANFDLAFGIHQALAPHARPELEIDGFKYHGERDLIGFVDGTGNPKTREDREAAALIPDNSGGSFVLTQKWVHDLPKFNRLTVPEQEAVIGRTKVEDVELEGEAMPPDSHVSRTDAEEDGVALKIYRRSTPYGTVCKHGLYFVAFACDPDRFEVQLRRMYGLDGDGLSDRLIEYSRAATGSYWFAPGGDDLAIVFGA